MHSFFGKGSRQKECQISEQLHGFSFLLQHRCHHFGIDDGSLALLPTHAAVTAFRCPFSLRCCHTLPETAVGFDFALEARVLPSLWNLLQSLPLFVATDKGGWNNQAFRFQTNVGIPTVIWNLQSWPFQPPLAHIPRYQGWLASLVALQPLPPPWAPRNALHRTLHPGPWLCCIEDPVKRISTEAVSSRNGCSCTFPAHQLDCLILSLAET